MQSLTVSSLCESYYFAVVIKLYMVPWQKRQIKHIVFFISQLAKHLHHCSLPYLNWRSTRITSTFQKKKKKKIGCPIKGKEKLRKTQTHYKFTMMFGIWWRKKLFFPLLYKQTHPKNRIEIEKILNHLREVNRKIAFQSPWQPPIYANYE